MLAVYNICARRRERVAHSTSPARVELVEGWDKLTLIPVESAQD